MTERRVAVTGLGAVSALGTDVEATWAGLVAGRSGIRPISLVDVAGLKFSNGGEVADFEPSEALDPRFRGLADRFAQFALAAAAEASDDAGIEWSSRLRQRTAVVTGSCVGGQTTEDAGFKRLYGDGRPNMHPLSIPRAMANAGASLISMVYGLSGPSFTLSTACASSNHAIGQAFALVRSGTCDLALAGGSEAPFSLGHLRAWEALRVVAPDTCRPFSRHRKGMILAEGGAMLVLEPLEAATARGAHVYAELAGFGMSADAHHPTQPSVEGPVAAMLSALTDAGIAREEVGYINAHGSGTELNDRTETAAIHRVFAQRADDVAVSATKSMLGHALGAAGALEAVATVLALDRGVLPPTVNYLGLDPDCDLDVIPHGARSVETEAALSNAFAFGGLNAVLAFRRARV